MENTEIKTDLTAVDYVFTVAVYGSLVYTSYRVVRGLKNVGTEKYRQFQKNRNTPK